MSNTNSGLLLITASACAAELCAQLAKAGLNAYVAANCGDEDFWPATQLRAVLIDPILARRCDCRSICRLRTRACDRHIPFVPLPFTDDRCVSTHASTIEYVERLQQFLTLFDETTRGRTLVSDRIVLDPAACTVTHRGRAVHLTPIGFRLLQFFMTNPDRVVSGEELLAHVWGRNDDPGRTVAMHIAHLRKALADQAANSLIRTVRGAGYLFRSGMTGPSLALPSDISMARPVPVRPRARRRKTQGWRALRPREAQLLELLLLNPGLTLSRECIATLVWGQEVIDLRTVDATVSRIRQVFLQRSLKDPVRGVIGRGYQINPLMQIDPLVHTASRFARSAVYKNPFRPSAEGKQP